MSEEKKLILQMVEKGTVSAEDALKLLEQTEEKKNSPSLKHKFLKIFIVEGDNTKVDINIPMGLAEVAMNLVPKENMKIQGKEVNFQDILRQIEEGTEGKIVDIDTVEDGKKTQVKISVTDSLQTTNCC